MFAVAGPVAAPAGSQGRPSHPGAGQRLLPRGPGQHALRPACGEPCSSAGWPPSTSPMRSSTGWWVSRWPSPAPALGARRRARVAGVAVSTVAAWWYEPWRPSATFSLRRIREVARVSIDYFWSSTFAVVFAQLDKVIISRVLGSAALGTYTVAQRTVTSPVNTVSAAVSTVSFSAFARGQNNPERAAVGRDQGRGRGRPGRAAHDGRPGRPGRRRSAVVYGSQWEAAIPVIQVLAPVAAVQALSSRHRGGDAGEGSQRLALPMGSGLLPSRGPRPCWCRRSGVWSA